MIPVTRRRLIAVLAFITAAVLVWAFVLGRTVTDEQRIQSAINSIVNAAEERDLNTITGYLHKDFTAAEFGYDRETSVALLRQVFLSYKVVHVNLRGLTVKLTGDASAEAVFVATVTVAQDQDSSGDDLTRQRGSDRFKVTFKKVGRDWLITRSAIVPTTAD